MKKFTKTNKDEYQKLFSSKLEIGSSFKTLDENFKLKLQLQRQKENKYYIFRSTERKDYDCIIDFKEFNIEYTNTCNHDLPKNMINSTIKIIVEQLN